MVCFTNIDNILLVSYTCNIYGDCYAIDAQYGNWSVGTIFLTLPLVVTAQEVENLSCDFSGCVGEDMVCYCSVAGGILYWWDRNSGFCRRTIVNDSNPTTDEPIVEVVDKSPSGGFTSKLTRRNISNELNGIEIRCSQSPIDQVTCRPSRTSRNSSFTLFVRTCQGKA